MNNGRRIGYARVSTTEQTIDLQQDALNHHHCQFIYTETASGKNADRLVLKKCLKSLRPGDTLVVWRLDRLGRSVHDLVNIMRNLDKRQINFESLTEKIETGSNTGKLIFHMFAALAEFERNLIRERTNAGLAAAKARGRIGGRRPTLTEEQVQEVLHLRHNAKVSVIKIATDYDVSRMTIYNVLKNNPLPTNRSRESIRPSTLSHH